MVFRRNTETATGRLHTAGVQAATGPIMLKTIAVSFFVVALAACSSMSGRSTMGNAAETKNSTDANKSANPAAVSPGSSTGTGAAAPR
jgi:hypothetical protein